MKPFIDQELKTRNRNPDFPASFLLKHEKNAAKKAAEAAAAVSGEVAVKKTDKKKVLKIILCVILALALIGIIYVAAVIITAPKIETDNIYSMLSQSSVLYDDEENIIDTAYGDQNRTIVEIGSNPGTRSKRFYRSGGQDLQDSQRL